jgi:hypothetical protein
MNLRASPKQLKLTTLETFGITLNCSVPEIIHTKSHVFHWSLRLCFLSNGFESDIAVERKALNSSSHPRSCTSDGRKTILGNKSGGGDVKKGLPFSIPLTNTNLFSDLFFQCSNGSGTMNKDSL